MAVVSINVEVLSSDVKDEKEVNLPKCFICLDTGIITYWKKTEQGEYEYVAHCICDAGDRYRYNGRESKIKSNYYIPAIDEITEPDTIAKENVNEFYQRNKGNEKIMQALRERLEGGKLNG